MPGEVMPAPVLLELFSVLSSERIRCCHWKSNAHLAEAVQGATDLDLLVDPARVLDFRRVLAEHDFKPLRPAPGKHYDGVENHLGFDRRGGNLIHLHVHYELVLGQQFVKDHRIPIEEQVLGSVRELDGVPVPSAAMELAILGIRAVLKYRARDAVKDIMGIRSPAIPSHIRHEAAWLLGQTSVDEVRSTLSELPVTLPDDLILKVIDLLTSATRPGVRPLMLRTRMRWAIRSFRRIGRPRATVRYLTALGRKRMFKLGIGTKHRMTPVAGGTTIAFVGSDGAGKSTVIDQITGWLSKRLDASTVYLGNPKGSRRIRLLKQSTRIARSGTRRIERLLDDRMIARLTREVWYVLLASRRVAEAKHRFRSYDDGLRRAHEGCVVLFDRYPLDEVQIDGRAMDGARLGTEIPSQHRSPLTRRLGERERLLYRRILPPDHVVVLTVSPDVSLDRKPDHDRASIEAKTAAVQRSGEIHESFAVIDADRRLEEVIDDVKATVWGWL